MNNLKEKRIGVFGGTFDPIHTGHIAIAKAALEQAHLDRILFVIASNPPHKYENRITSASLRAAMTADSIEGIAEFEASHIEIDHPGPSYTADTLKRLHKLFTPSQLFFIVGYDSALDLPHWHEPNDILQLAKLLVAPRPENKAPLAQNIVDNCMMLHMDEYPISSSEIRERMERGENMENWLPEAAVRFITSKGLYRANN
ncbi:MAG: nicotinate-nucleotide adenylyltransferase [Candidatus Hydrogenedentes bacterium]|nr:nicotinate-nucleotide adenylyltransferase [Candidatus Hydrogenedentota bacterium]